MDKDFGVRGVRRPLIKSALLLSAALGLAAPGEALAQQGGQTALEERVRQLEEALAAVKAELQAARAETAQTDGRLITLEKSSQAQPVASTAAKPADGFQTGGATVKIGGFVKAEALASDYGHGDTPTNLLGRDYYLPSSIPVGGAASGDPEFDAHAKQTRLSITVNRPTEGHTLGAYVEGDFQSAPGTQGTERTTNAYDFAVRRAYVTFDGWLFGQDWTTFQNVNVMPETADFIGPSEGTVFVRQPQVRHTAKLGANSSLMISFENPETSVETTISATIMELDDDTLPDAVVRLNTKLGKADFTLAGIVRELAVDGMAVGGQLVNDEAMGWGLSLSGKIPVGAKDDLRFMVSGGEGIGRYLGLNFAPDAIVIGGRGLEAISVVNGFIAYRHGWTERLRSSVIGSYIQVDQPPGAPSGAGDSGYSAAANLFFSPVKGLDLGMEYRHAKREVASGAEGSLGRLHLVAKHSF